MSQFIVLGSIVINTDYIESIELNKPLRDGGEVGVKIQISRELQTVGETQTETTQYVMGEGEWVPAGLQTTKGRGITQSRAIVYYFAGEPAEALRAWVRGDIGSGFDKFIHLDKEYLLWSKGVVKETPVTPPVVNPPVGGSVPGKPRLKSF